MSQGKPWSVAGYRGARPTPGERVGVIPPLDDEVGRLLRRRGVPALATAVCRGAELLLERAWGFADIERRVGVSSEHVFQACSVTKMFTATAVLQLAERGAIQLDEPLERYLPPPGPGWERVTARHLLSHHAGLRDPLRAALVLRPGERPPSARELVVRAGVRRASPRPAGRGSYANVHYTFLGWLVEAVARVPLAEYVEREILEPMALADLAYGYPARFLPRAAKGYIGAVFERALLRILAGKQALALEGPRTGWVLAIEPYVPAEWGAAGIVGTAGALARFGALHLGFPLGPAQRVLGRQAAEMMRQPVGRIRAGPFSILCGLGWWLGGDGVDAFAEHWGRGPGFTAVLRVVPESGVSIALVLNRVQVDPRPWTRVLSFLANFGRTA